MGGKQQQPHQNEQGQLIKSSQTGNWTPVSWVKARCSNHYTIWDWCSMSLSLPQEPIEAQQQHTKTTQNPHFCIQKRHVVSILVCCSSLMHTADIKNTPPTPILFCLFVLSCVVGLWSFAQTTTTNPTILAILPKNTKNTSPPFCNKRLLPRPGIEPGTFRSSV